jgi:hypothetical protein
METLKRDWNDGTVRRSIYRILENNLLASMSTVSGKNRAHINIGYFAYLKKGKLAIYYLSYPNSMHSKNLLRNPSMGMAIFDSKQKWGGHDRGMQLLGICKQVKGRSLLRKVEAIYGGRFKKYAKWKSQFTKERKGKFEMRFYRFVPEVAMFLDEGEKEYRDALVIVSLN